MITKSYLKGLVGKDKLRQAIDEWMNIQDSSYDELIMISARLKRIDSENNIGCISSEDYTINKNIIRASFLSTIDNSNLSKGSTEKPSSNQQPNSDMFENRLRELVQKCTQIQNEYQRQNPDAANAALNLKREIREEEDRFLIDKYSLPTQDEKIKHFKSELEKVNQLVAGFERNELEDIIEEVKDLLDYDDIPTENMIEAFALAEENGFRDSEISEAVDRGRMSRRAKNRFAIKINNFFSSRRTLN